jgi:hypothetical protein
MLLHFDDEHRLARRVTKAAGDCGTISRHRFPDDGSSSRSTRLPRRVAPALAAPAERSAGTAARGTEARAGRDLTLLAPYLLHAAGPGVRAGEAVSQRHVGGFLALLTA